MLRIMKNRARKVALAAGMLLGTVVVAAGQTPSPAPSPTPPLSHIFVIDVAHDRGRMKFGAPLKISEWDGYNNQPFFMPDGRSVLYTSIRADKQADIYRCDLTTRTTARITDTKESEYSPTLMPDGKNISVIRVEADSTQRLWKFPLAGGQPSLVFESIEPVGYHWWIDDHTVALFILGGTGKQNTLQIVDTRTGKAETIAENPGRILRSIPHQKKLSFVHKISTQEWVIEAFDLKTRNTTALVKTFVGVEDYAWTTSGLILMARDSKLFSWKSADYAWQELADFSKFGLKKITRIAVSPKGDRIAVVARPDPAH